MFKKLFFITTAAGLLASHTGVFAQEAEDNNGADEKDSPKLVKVTTLEEAFVRSLQTRQQLANRAVALAQALRAEEDEGKKKELRADFDKTNQALQSVKVAMEVIFGIGNRREYEYVADTIYLKVGTVEETFARAVRTREALKQAIVKKTEEKNAAEDAETVQKLGDEIKATTKRYQVVVASLQLVFGVQPQRNYTYNPKNATLYLNVTDEEVEQLKAKIAELRKQQGENAEETPE
ncbi:MAG: hypothetical protein RRC34_10235 [Lentisphaeria bacterium]|nr:hypothetical protein [Lentisphaeria bacterium]